MPIIRVYGPEQPPEYEGNGSNTAAAVMAVMLAKAAEPVEMFPEKLIKTKAEKTRPGNPNRLTIRQHVFPTKSISRFANQNRLVSVHDLGRGRVFSAKPTNAVFWAERAWDQRTERQMTTIEDEFQSLVVPIVAGLSRTILPEQKAAVDLMYALWFMRPRYRELTQQEIFLKGNVGSKLTKEQEENLESNGYLFARVDGAMPARQMNGLQIMIKVNEFARKLENDIPRWGVIETLSGELIVPDLPCHGILPITPRIALVHSSPDGHITERNLAQINKAMRSTSQYYFFARDFANSPF
ncbi:MAG: hypothetical protein P4M05_26470 [Bradyrhizobium sp.]|nr:hypothetical protein [Bradyrhizobium sp.]